jgi:hypothetical protein
MRLCEFVGERGGNVRYLFSLFLNALEQAPRNAPELSSEMHDMIELERNRELRNVIDEMRVRIPTKFELLKLIGSSKDSLDTGAVIALANAMGLHVSGRTIQNYLLDFERMKLVRLERIRKRQGHSQLVKPLIPIDILGWMSADIFLEKRFFDSPRIETAFGCHLP